MTSEAATQTLKALIEAQKDRSFVAEYRPKATDADGLGLMVAHYFKWDGQQIVEAFLGALEDANFHTLRAQIVELANKDGLEVA